MTNINLLPWRERLNEERTRQFYFALAGSVILAVIIMMITHAFINYRINDQMAQDNYLNSQINMLNVKLREILALEKTKDSILARMSIIQDLQQDRMLIVHMFDEIVNVLPKGIHLTEIQRKGSSVVLIGKTESNSTVSELMRNINKSSWLSNPELREIKADPGNVDHLSEFSLSLALANPYDDKQNKRGNADKEIKSQ